MKKIYVVRKAVTLGAWEMIGIFSTLEKAQEYVNKHDEDYLDITEYDLDKEIE